MCLAQEEHLITWWFPTVANSVYIFHLSLKRKIYILMVCYIFALLMSERWANPSPLMCDGCWRHQQSIIIWLLDFVKSWDRSEWGCRGNRRQTHECQGRRACARLSVDPQEDGQGEDSSGGNDIENKRRLLKIWNGFFFFGATILVLFLYKNWRVSLRISLCSQGGIFAYCFRGD